MMSIKKTAILPTFCRLWIVLGVMMSVIHLTVQDLTSEGCYKDDFQNPEFVVSPGGYDPNLMNPATCSALCQDNNYLYAGLQQGDICLCSNSIQKCVEVTADECSTTCTDNSTTSACGGPDGITSIYEAQMGVEMSGLLLKSSATDVNVMEEVTFVITLEKGVNVQYRLDYGDGQEWTSQNATGMTKHQYPVHGKYSATVYASDNYKPQMSSKLKSISSTVDIEVHRSLGNNIQVDCPQLVRLEEEFLCNVTLIEGPAFTLTIDKGDYSNNAIYHMPATQYSFLGHDVPQVEISNMQNTFVDNVILMHDMIVNEAGYIIAFEAYITKPGTIEFLVMAPSCTTGEFCYGTGQCESACSIEPDQTQCSSSTLYYSPAASCYGDATSKSYDNISKFYQKGGHTTTAVKTGYLYVNLADVNVAPIKVHPGDVLGFRTSDGAQVGNRNATVEVINGVRSEGDKSAPAVDSGPWVTTNFAHFARAIVSHPAVAAVNISYSLVGNYTFTATCEEQVSGAVVTNSSIIVVAIDIGAVNISAETFIWATNATVQMETTVINGSGFFLHWDFGDGISEELYEKNTVTNQSYPRTHSYATDGSYKVVVLAYNIVDNKTDSVDIFIEYPVTDQWSISSNSPLLFPPGTVDLILQFPAGRLPTNATANIIWGESTTSDIIALPNGTADQTTILTVSHNYSKAGEFNVTSVLSNQVSNLTLSHQILLYEKIEGLSASIYYVDKNTGSTPRQALGTNKNVVPVNSNVTLNMKTVRGTVMGYVVYDGSGTFILNTTSNPIEYSVGQGKTYNLTIYAWNTLQGNSDPALISILTQDVTSGLEITDFFITTNQNETKTFEINIGTIGTDVCMLISYNDTNDDPMAYGDLKQCLLNYTEYDFTYMGPVELSMNVTHKFMVKGIYHITVVVFNTVSISNSSLVFSVTDFPCPIPTMTILDAKTIVSEAIAFKRSQSIRIFAEATLNCTAKLNATKRWYVHRVDEKFGLELTAINISEISSHNKSVLVIPPLFLPYGYYKFTFLMTIVSTGINVKYPWKRTLYTYVRVTPSPLIGIMISGSMSEVVLGLGQNLTLTPGTSSIDPDFPQDKNFNVTWLCRRVVPTKENFTMNGVDYDMTTVISVPGTNDTKPTPDKGGCFGTGPGVLNLKGGVWAIDTRIFFGPSISYEIISLISKNNRTAKARIILNLISSSTPIVNIECQNMMLCTPVTDGLIINPTSRLGVEAQCIEVCTEPLYYEWKIYDDSGTAEIADARDYMVGENMKEMALSSMFFGNYTESNAFWLELHVQGPSGTIGESTLHLIVNRPPEGGFCTLTPESGRALMDNFKIEFWDWKDPEMNSKFIYTIYLTIDGTVGKSVLQSTDESSVEVILPYGTLHLMAEISDEQGAIAVYEIATLTTTLPSKEDYDNFIKSNYIYNLIGGGDQDVICQVLNAVSSIENSGAYSTPSSSSENDTYSSEQQQASDAERVSTYLDGITTLTAVTLKDIEMVSSTISNVVGDGEDVDSRGKQTTVELLDKLRKVLKQNITLLAPQDVQEFATFAMSSISAVFKSVSDVVIFGKTMPSDLLHVDTMDYDTDIGDDVDFEMPDTLDAKQRLAIRDDTASNAKEQFKKMSAVIDEIRNKVFDTLLPDEPSISVKVNGLSSFMGKFFGSNVSHQTFDLEESSFTLPSFCSLLHKEEGCNETDTPVGISAITWPTIVHTYGKDVNVLANNSKTVEIEIYDTNNTKMEVENVTEPIEIIIPRTSDNETISLPEPVSVNVSLKWNEFMMYHQFNVTNPGSSVNIEITPDDSRAPIIVFLRRSKKPTLFVYDVVTRLIDIRLKNGSTTTYDLFVSSQMVGRETGVFYLGIAELNSTSDYVLPNNFTYDSVVRNFTTNYSLRIFTSGCYFYEEAANKWIDRGCWVKDSDYLITRCMCTHLTTFGSGFFIMPNTVDFDYVFAHADFNDNLTIYLTMIITFVIFILLAIWARWKDKKDFEKLGASPMPDNRPDHSYLYEILVFTGGKRNAATDSQVFFILSGDDDETEVRQFGDSKRRIFRKGETDVFIMAVPKPLGNLNYMRVWHDNSGIGEAASWYLNYIVVRDIQNGDNFEFIANCWFAVEDGDGCIDRLLPVAGSEQMTEFGHLFSNSSQRNIADGHLWFSVFLRPPRSRFTRLQRVGCCVAFLYLSMLVNAMWYGTVDTGSGKSAFKLGPFSLSTEQIGVGIISNLIVFPPNFIIVYFFRKARLRKLRPSRIEKALARQRAKDKEEEEDEMAKRHKVDTSSLHGSKQELMKSNVSLNHQHEEKDAESGKAHNFIKKEKKFTLPWIFRIIAWILVFGCIGASVFFLWAYGISFGNEKTKKWITSLVVSFFSSVLITEPIKLFLIALLISAICKKNDDDDDADEDEEDPTLSDDEEYLHGTVQQYQKTKRYHPPNPEALKKARELRLKEIKMWAILREIFGYLLFLWVLVVVSYGNRDPNAYYLNNSLTQQFIRIGKDNDFTALGNVHDFWDWTREVLVPSLRAQKLYNGKPPFGAKGFLNDQVNRLMGHAIMRQIRIKKGMCDAPKIVMNFSRCTGAYSDIFFEDEESYDIGWKNVLTTNKPSADSIKDAFRYKDAKSLDGYPFVGELDVYGGGGYVLHLTGKTSSLINDLTSLETSGWIDRYTRAVLIEFSVYNSQVNLFAVCTIQVEFVPGGGFFQNYRFDGIRLLEYHEGFGLMVMICEIAFVIFILYFTVREITEMCKERGKWCRSYWNFAELLIILISYAAIVAYVFRLIYTREVLEKFNDTKGNAYVNLQYVYMLDQLYGGFIGFVVFLATVKFIKLLRFNKRMGILSQTLANAWNELAIFGMCFMVVFFAFAQLFYVMMCSVSADFSSFMKTVEYTFSMMLNKFNFSEISMGSPVLGPMSFFIFALMTNIVLINLFLTIVIGSFQDIAHNIFKQPSEYEIVDFIVKRFVGFLGFGHGPEAPPLPYSQTQLSTADSSSTRVVNTTQGTTDQCLDNGQVTVVDDLSQKMNLLLNYINVTYCAGTIDLSDEAVGKSAVTRRSVIVSN